jgi:signal transduction histidine kinase
VLTNLLGNAAKFTREVESPRVTLGGAPAADGRLRLRVTDNGAGFDMSQVGRLFKPFGRLHSASAFQGTGIGLTIVQRIIERHGGKVSAHGEPGVGAWFEFTLAPDKGDGESAFPPVQ